MDKIENLASNIIGLLDEGMSMNEIRKFAIEKNVDMKLFEKAVNRVEDMINKGEVSINNDSEFWGIIFWLFWGLGLVLFGLGGILMFFEYIYDGGRLNFIESFCRIFSLTSLLFILYGMLMMVREGKVAKWKIVLVLIWLLLLSFFTYMSVTWWGMFRKDGVCTLLCYYP